MFYRLLIKSVAIINDSYVHKFCYLYTIMFCKLKKSALLKNHLPLSPVKIMNLSFPNPVGLAAGFDRDAQLLCCSEVLGFGFVEVGTVNIDAGEEIKPELSDKETTIIENLKKARDQYKETKNRQLWGVSLGSLRNTLDEHTVADYTRGIALFSPYVDYIVINLSRPGSPVRALTPDFKVLTQFLHNIKQNTVNSLLSNGKEVPIVIKIAIDYANNEAVNHILLLAKEQGYDGAIIAFENWQDINKICEYTRKLKTSIASFPLIVVGGIRTANDAKQVLVAGASLVQTYTSLVGYGPSGIRKMISDVN